MEEKVMGDIEKRARELLAAQYPGDCGYETREWIMEGRYGDAEAINAIIAALTPPEGSDQNLLELAATFETCIPFLPSVGQRNIGKAVSHLRQMAMGYALVPLEPTAEMISAAEEAHMPFGDMGIAISAAICAGPEVP